MNLKDILYVYFFWLKVINMKLELIGKLKRILYKNNVMMLYDWKYFYRRCVEKDEILCV